MTQNRSDRGDPGRLALEALAPRRRWVEQLPSIAREAALRRGERASWAYGLAAAGRWVIPLALGMAVACWIAPAMWAPPSPRFLALLLAGSDREALAALALERPR
jgi:hypothetical protein